MINTTVSWNKFDRLIFRIENVVKNIKEGINEADASEPDVELMIAAETEHLQNENEKLKRREMPLHMAKSGEEYICPKCRGQITDMNAKYCSNCGQRVIRYMASRYSSNMVETP